MYVLARHILISSYWTGTEVNKPIEFFRFDMCGVYNCRFDNHESTKQIAAKKKNPSLGS
jgi:hypothetical protein